MSRWALRSLHFINGNLTSYKTNIYLQHTVRCKMERDFRYKIKVRSSISKIFLAFAIKEYNPVVLQCTENPNAERYKVSL